VKDAYCNVAKWSKPQKPGFSVMWTPMRPVIRKEAKGVVLIITPFNYPLWLSFVPLVRAFTLCNVLDLIRL
jgi:aldehyde dehydrogenase (NAD+)/aldehyde dehydrogenase (NAD(P)+)